MKKLMDVLVELDAPILAVINTSRRPQELLESHMAGRRSATLAARLRAWARYRMWLRQAYGVGYPRSAHHVLDYLMDRRAEPCTRGTLSAVYSMLKFAEQAMGLPEGERWSADPVVVTMAKGIISQAATSISSRSQGPANAPLVGVLARLEWLVCDRDHPHHHRLLAWWMLFASWTASRFDDHRGLAPQDVTVNDGDLDAVFRRSKTTGRDKPVQLRRAVVAKEAWIVESDWLSCGWALWAECAPRERDYFLVQWGPDGAAHYRELGYPEFAGRMRGVLTCFTDAEGAHLDNEWVTFLRPHSWRSFLPSAATALGAPAECIRWLSAWKAQSSDAYVRTSRARTVMTQSTVAKLLRLHLGGADPIGEAQALRDLGTHLRERRCDEIEIDRILGALRMYTQEPTTSSLWDTLATTTGRGSGSASAAEATRELEGASAQKESASTSEEENVRGSSVEGYVIATSRRRGTRCLHKIGLCYRKPGVHYMDFEACGANRPRSDRYDVYCGDCWRQVPRTGETSASKLGSDTGSSRHTSSSSSTSSD